MFVLCERSFCTVDSTKISKIKEEAKSDKNGSENSENANYHYRDQSRGSTGA